MYGKVYSLISAAIILQYMAVLAIFIGFLSGELVNYLADTLPYRRRITKPFCPVCGSDLKWRNYFILPRRCLICGTRRGWRTWIVDIIAIISTVWLWLAPPNNLNFPIGFIILIYFGLVTIIDLEHRLILHPVSIAGAILGLIIGIWFHGPLPTIIGGVAGFGIMFILYLFGNLFVKFISRRQGKEIEEDALGFGDVNLTGVLGLILGWPGILVGLILAILIGGFISLIYIIGMLVTRRFQYFQAIPYGPFLITGAIIILFFRDALIAYFGM